jgi:NADH:ubiquinone reductase (H+-translocating)
MRPSYFGHDEFARFAPGLKSLNDAETIRTKILSAFELAESTHDEKERARQMTFLLVGAGPTGVELAASIAQLAAVTLRKNFRKIDPAKSRIVLLDGGSRILPTFSESLSRKAAKRLTKLGIEVSTGAKVEKVDDQGVIAAGIRIPSATVLWTAGVSASPVVKMLGTKTDRAGRAFVGAFMDIREAPDVFVVGDAATMTQDGHPVPGVAQAAIQQGRFVGNLIANRAKGRKDGLPFRYHNKGNMAVVGKNFALLEAGHLRSSGFVTWLIWAALHVLALPQLQNRFRVQTQWFWSYLSGQRSSRLEGASTPLFTISLAIGAVTMPKPGSVRAAMLRPSTAVTSENRLLEAERTQLSCHAFTSSAHFAALILMPMHASMRCSRHPRKNGLTQHTSPHATPSTV